MICQECLKLFGEGYYCETRTGKCTNVYSFDTCKAYLGHSNTNGEGSVVGAGAGARAQPNRIPSGVTILILCLTGALLGMSGLFCASVLISGICWFSRLKIIGKQKKHTNAEVNYKQMSLKSGKKENMLETRLIDLQD